MKTIISHTIMKSHPNIDGILWRTACIAKDHDQDITINGLLVKVTKSPTVYWTGTAWPYEETQFYSKRLSHPAGRIDLRLTLGMLDRSIIVLFAHELRHIGHFHRGRKESGILSDNGSSQKVDPELEKDCIEFEQEVADAVLKGTEIFRGKDEQSDHILY